MSPPPVMRQKMLAPRRGAGNGLIKKILVPGPVPFEISNLKCEILSQSRNHALEMQMVAAWIFAQGEA